MAVNTGLTAYKVTRYYQFNELLDVGMIVSASEFFYIL